MDNKKRKSLYEHFQNYTKEQIDLVLTRFKREPKTMAIIKKKFGDDLNGVEGYVSLSYSENFRLETTLTRLEKVLKFVQKLQRIGKTNDQIKTILSEKDDVRFYKYVESLLNNQEVIPTEKFNLNKYLKIKGIDKKFLSDALPYHNNSSEAFAFKYTYGINVKELDKSKIAEILNTTEQEVEKYVRNIIRNLDNIIDNYRKVIKELDLPREVKPNKKVKEPKEETTIEVRIIGNNSRRKEFINYFATNVMTLEEKKVLLDKIRQIIELDKVKKLKGIKVIKEYFGAELDLVYEGSYLEQSDRLAISNIVKTISDALSNPDKYKTKQKQEVPKQVPKVKNFESVLNLEEKTEEEIAIYKQQVIDLLKSSRYENTKILVIFKKYFGENFDQTYQGTYDRTERAMIAQTVRNINKKLSKPKKEVQEKKTSTGRVKDKTILSFFDLEGKSPEEIKEIKENLFKILKAPENQNKKSIIYLKKYFGEDFNGVCNIKYDKNERLVMSQYLKNIFKTKKQKENLFEEYFITYLLNNSNEIEQETIKKNYESIKIYLSVKSPVLYQSLTKIYSENLDEVRKNTEECNSITLNNLKTFIKNNRSKYLNNNFRDINHYNGLYIKFSNNVVSSLPKEETEERIKIFIEIKRSSMSKFINQLLDLYSFTLDKNTDNKQVSISFKNSFKSFISDLEDFLALDLIKYKEVIEKEFKSLYGEIKGTEEFTEEEIKSVIEQQLLSSTQTKELIIKIYGEDYKTKYRFNNLNKNEQSLIKYFIERCKDKLLNPEKKRRCRYGSIIDSIIGDIKGPTRATEIDKLYLILDSKNHDSKAYKLLDYLLKNNLSINSLDNKQDQMNVRQYIRILKEELSKFSYINYTKEDEIIITSTPDEMNNLHSLSYLVFRFTKAYKKPLVVAEKLKVSIEQIMDIYLMYPEYISLETLLQFAVYNQPLYIFKVLDLPYYRNLLSYLTQQEQELLYLSMVEKTNKAMNNKEKASILNMSKEEVKEYKITSNNEEVNKLNLYLK